MGKEHRTRRTPQQAGLSQVELAELSHIRQSRISEFETGRYSTANMSLKPRPTSPARWEHTPKTCWKTANDA
ncbi:hypothetical protein LU08_09195 [Bifidobacterium adolescentis]|nr:hypothetical protein LU08_09195 [Bifidobacterium adolescentis]